MVAGVATYFWTNPTASVVNDMDDDRVQSITRHNTSAVPEIVVQQEAIKQWVSGDRPMPNELTDEEKVFFNNPPYSLQNSAPPSPLGINDDGSLMIDERIKFLFEYYLTAIGEETVEELIQRIKYDLYAQLYATSPTAYQRGIELLEGYILYRNHVGEIKNEFAQRYHDATEYSLERALELKQTLWHSRSQFMDKETSTAFFQQEDEYDLYMISKAQIMANAEYSPAEREAALVELNQTTPLWVEEQNEQEKRISTLRSNEQHQRDLGATDDDIQAMRSQKFGKEAAEMLRALDERRAQWKTKVARYRQEATEILSRTASPEEADQLLNDLRQQHFSEQEQIRIRSLDKIELYPTMANDYALEAAAE